MKHRDLSWLNRPIYYQWITFERSIDPAAYAAEEIDRAVSLGAGTYLYYIQAGGRVVYESQLAESAKGVRGDLIEAFVAESHRRGIKFVAGWLATIPACGVEVSEHPDWMRVKLDGSRNEVSLCYNSPYRDFLFGQVEEVLSLYEVDGIYFDQVPVGCFCHYCRSNYEAKYRERFPTLPEGAEYRAGPSVYIQPGEAFEYGVSRSVALRLNRFAAESRRSWVGRIRGIIDTVRYSVAFVANRIELTDAGDFRDDIDAFLPEAGMAYSYRPATPFHMSVERHLSGVYGKKPVWEVVKYDKMGVRSGSIDRFTVLLSEAISHNHIPVLRDQDTLALRSDSYRDRVFTIARLMNDAATLFRELPSIAYAAVLHSENTFYYTMRPGNESFFGMLGFLKERAIPYRVVSEEDLVNGDVEANVLLLPNSVCLGDATVEAIAAYSKSGGAIVATARTGELRPDGSRRDRDVIGELAGVARITWIENRKQFPVPMLAEIPIPALHNSDYAFVRISEKAHPTTAGVEGALTDFNYGYVETAIPANRDFAAGGEGSAGKVLAWICDFDQRHINAKHFNRRIPFPGKPRIPFLVVSEEQGRCAYLAAPLGDRSVRGGAEELQELLLGVIKWCGGDASVMGVDIPASIKLTVRGSVEGGSLGIMLHSDEMLDIKSVGFRNARVRIRCGGRALVKSKILVGEEASFTTDGDDLVMTIPSIEPVAMYLLLF